MRDALLGNDLAGLEMPPEIARRRGRQRNRDPDKRQCAQEPEVVPGQSKE